MRGKTILVFLVLACSQGISAGEIYRCVAANGGVTYTNIACPADSQAQYVSSYEPEPAVRSAQVDAEAARAAEISARLAQQAAADARNAAYEAEQAAYREPAEWESLTRTMAPATICCGTRRTLITVRVSHGVPAVAAAIARAVVMTAATVPATVAASQAHRSRCRCLRRARRYACATDRIGAQLIHRMQPDRALLLEH
jgi:hypothetical protein